MNFQKNQIKESEVELKFEISPAEYQPFLVKAAVKMSETSKIEGFRPGKAPYQIIKQRFGETAVFQEALDDVISHFYFKAITKENLNTVGQPKIEVEKFAVGDDLIFKATAFLIPKVIVGDWKKVKVEKKEIKVEETEVEKMIEDLRKLRAKEVLAERQARLGDLVEVDFLVSLDKVVIEGGSGKKYPLVLGEGQMIPGFEEQIAGLTKDEEKEFQLKFPEEYQNKTMAGKMCDFKVKVLSVFERTLPEVNDDWAKTLGASNVDDLKKKIRDNLENQQQFQEEQKAEMAMLNKIVEQAEIGELPEALVDNEAKRMVHEYEDSISSQGLNFADYLQNINKSEKDLLDDFKPKATARVKTSLVIKEIADAEKIEVSSAELRRETERILEEVKGNKEAEQNVLGEGYQHYLATIARNSKAISALKQECLK